jgi:hypothetical protein
LSLAPLFLALVPPAPQAPASQDLAPTLRAEARAQASVATVEVGEPFTLTLVVRHGGEDPPALDATALESDPTWAVLEPGERVSLPEPGDHGLLETRASWRVVALEPGQRELPAPRVTLEGPDGAPQVLEVARASLEVQGLLAPGEDAPRPPGGFVGLGPESATPGWRRALPWGVAGLVACALGAAWLGRRGRRAPAVVGPTPLERLAALEAGSLERPEQVVALHVELTRLLRAAVDDRLGASPSGLSDLEWAQRLAARLGAERARPYAELLEACEPVKYGAEQPTHWAARERVARARELAAVVDAPAAAQEVAA